MEQGDVDLEDLFKQVSYDEYLNGAERKKLKNLEDRSYYDSLFADEWNRMNNLTSHYFKQAVTLVQVSEWVVFSYKGVQLSSSKQLQAAATDISVQVSESVVFSY